MYNKTLILSRPLIERSSIVERVVSKVTEGYSFAILGPNYIGKTTFLKNLKYNLETFLDNSVGVFINLKEAYRSDENLYSKISKMIIESLSEISKSEKKIPNATSSESFLVFLNELTSRTNFESLFLLFDHVEILPEFYVKSLVDTVAKLTSKKKKDKLRFILVGSSMLLKIVNEQKDNVKRLETERLLDFTLEESHELVKRYFDMFKIDVRAEALDLLYKKTLGHPNLLQRLCDIIVNILLQQLNDQEALVLFKNYLKSLDIAINNKVINKLINRLGTFENLLQKFCNIIEKHFLEKWPMSKLVESINLCMEIGEIELTSKDLKRLTDDINTYPQIFWKLITIYMNDLTNRDHISIDENHVNLSIKAISTNGIQEDFFREAAINIENDLGLFHSYLQLTQKPPKLLKDAHSEKFPKDDK